MPNTYIVIILLCVFCLVMLVLGWLLLTKQQQKNASNELRIYNLLQMLNKQQKNRIISIQTVANAMQQGQCEYIEGCIRIRMLLEQVQPELLADAPISIFETIYQATMHIPIKDNWEALDKKVKTKLMLEMDALKSSHEKTITEGLQAILNHSFDLKPLTND